MPTQIIRQRNELALHRIRAMEKQQREHKIRLALASHTETPQQPSAETRLSAIVARAQMTDSAPASFFGECVPDADPAKCPCCLKSYTDWNETEFIGWHGECVECFFKREKK